MNESRNTSRKRPWLAALLALAIAGLGHMYLRRWGRALSWFVLILGTGLLLTTRFADSSVTNVVDLPFVVLGPILALFVLSAVDAYRLAAWENRRTAGTHCPVCGREVELDLEFCHWCTTPLSPTAVDSSAESESSDEASELTSR